METEYLKEKIKNKIENLCLIEIGKDAKEDTNLFKEGIIDSFSYIELVKFLENEFNIIISDEELMSEALNSYSTIIFFVKSKINQG
jgi:D-alanine--poly(phosphoribitol) ligase subunit 2